MNRNVSNNLTELKCGSVVREHLDIDKLLWQSGSRVLRCMKMQSSSSIRWGSEALEFAIVHVRRRTPIRYYVYTLIYTSSYDNIELYVKNGTKRMSLSMKAFPKFSFSINDIWKDCSGSFHQVCIALACSVHCLSAMDLGTRIVVRQQGLCQLPKKDKLLQILYKYRFRELFWLEKEKWNYCYASTNDWKIEQNCSQLVNISQTWGDRLKLRDRKIWKFIMNWKFSFKICHGEIQSFESGYKNGTKVTQKKLQVKDLVCVVARHSIQSIWEVLGFERLQQQSPKEKCFPDFCIRGKT